MSIKNFRDIELSLKEAASPEDQDDMPDWTFRLYHGIDGTPVLEIETPGIDEDPEGIRLRVWLNDSLIYAHPDVPDQEEPCLTYINAI